MSDHAITVKGTIELPVCASPQTTSCEFDVSREDCAAIVTAGSAEIVRRLDALERRMGVIGEMAHYHDASGGGVYKVAVTLEEDRIVEPDVKADGGFLVFLEQAGAGCVSGSISEWPQLKPACRWAATEIAALKKERDELRAEQQRTYTHYRNIVERDDARIKELEARQADKPKFEVREPPGVLGWQAHRRDWIAAIEAAGGKVVWE